MNDLEGLSSPHSRTRIEFASRAPSLNIAEQLSFACPFLEQWTWPFLPFRLRLAGSSCACVVLFVCT